MSNISEIEQDALRTKGILKPNEIAYKEGNLVYAENVLNGSKRLINVLQNSPLTENKKIILG